MPTPFADEDPSSLLFRLAKHHFITPKILYDRYLGRTFEQFGDVGSRPEIWEQVETIAGYGIEFIERNGWHHLDRSRLRFRGTTIKRTWLSERRRVAPGVLSDDGEQPYARITWRFKALPCDVATGEMLIERCPRCLLPLTWGDMTSIYRCQECGFDLRKIERSEASKEMYEAARTIAQMIGLLPSNGVDLSHPFNVEDVGLRLDLLEWCAAFEGRVRGNWITRSSTNAWRGVEGAQTWPALLERAVSLTQRKYEKSGSYPDFAKVHLELQSMPNLDARKAALLQLADMLRQIGYVRLRRKQNRSRPKQQQRTT